MSDSGLLNLYASGNTDATAEILRRLAHYRALLASQPRVWTAEEIKDAPDGEYLIELYSEYVEPYWGPVLFTKSECISHNERRIFGPMPQPTTPNKEKT